MKFDELFKDIQEIYTEAKEAPKGKHYTKRGALRSGDADADGDGGPKYRSDPTYKNPNEDAERKKRTPEQQAEIDKKIDQFNKNSAEFAKENPYTFGGGPSHASPAPRQQSKEGGEDKVDTAYEKGDIDKDDVIMIKRLRDDEGQSLADDFMEFASLVSAAEQGREVDIDKLRIELNALDERLEALKSEESEETFDQLYDRYVTTNEEDGPIRVEAQKLNHIGGVTARSHYQFSSQAKFEEVLPRLKMIYHRILVNGEELKDEAAEDNQEEYDYYHKVELNKMKREAEIDALEDRIQDALAAGHIDQSDAREIRKLGKFPDEDAEGKIDKDRMKCNSPRRTSGGSKKFVVKACKDGKEKVVRFGDPNMKIKKSNPKRRKSFRARHKCDQKKDKFSAGYWSCKKW